MKKQKICIIGGSLTGLVTAVSLSKLNFEIDLITGNLVKNLKSNRTIAISENNFDFLKKLNISSFLKKEVWTCSNMKLYTEIKKEKFSEIFELNKKNKNIFYMLENLKTMKFMMKKIKKIKSISLIKNETVSSIFNSGLLKAVKFKNNISKYNLIIICAGYNSVLIKNLFNHKIIENPYKEIAITTTLEHKKIKNNIARQIFLDNAIFAMLPISKTKRIFMEDPLPICQQFVYYHNSTSMTALRHMYTEVGMQVLASIHTSKIAGNWNSFYPYYRN